MPSQSNINLLALSAAAASGAGAVFLFNFLKTKAVEEKWDNPYEKVTMLHEYLMMHFGTPDQLLPYENGPRSALEFPARCADKCFEVSKGITVRRALDVGCAVGRSTFELTKYFPEVVGIDFSQSFIDAANYLKRHGSMDYQMKTEGNLKVQCTAKLGPEVKPERASFYQGDACNISPELGQFEVVMAANLLCRLPYPRKFLQRLKSLILPGGYLVMPSPYSVSVFITSLLIYCQSTRNCCSLLSFSGWKSIPKCLNG